MQQPSEVADKDRSQSSEGTNPVAPNGDSNSEQTNSRETTLAVYHEVSARFRGNLDGFWTRSNFFLVVQAGLLSVFAVIANQSASHLNLTLIDFVVGLVGLSQACLGLVGTLLNLDHLAHWRKTMRDVANEVDERGAHANAEEYAMKHLTPSRLVIGVNVSFILGWLALLGVLLKLG